MTLPQIGLLALLGAALAAGLWFGGRRLARRYWEKYSEERATIYQPLILMAIASDTTKVLGPPFAGARRLGDWTIVELALLQWSKGLSGFALQGFCRIFDENGFGEYERKRLSSWRPGVRAEAAQRLGQMLYVKAVPNLLHAMNEPRPDVRRMASWALANMGQTDLAGGTTTADKPRELEDAPEGSQGSISGRFSWDDGTPVRITDREESAFLLHDTGGMSGAVESVPRRGRDNKQVESKRWATYRSEYLLTWLNTRWPTTLKAVLKQAVEDYYAISTRRRANIPSQDGCETQNVDFVFTRFKDPGDRVSVTGSLSYPSELPSYYKKADDPAAVVILDGEDSDFHAEYLSYKAVKSYRLHEVPPGKYTIRAAYAVFGYAGRLVVSEHQPMTHDLELRAR